MVVSGAQYLLLRNESMSHFESEFDKVDLSIEPLANLCRVDPVGYFIHPSESNSTVEE